MASVFTSLPKEFYIPDNTEVIFVQDFNVKEVLGGAELTSDAIIKASPYKLFEVHSSSVTEAMLKRHKNKTWVFGNQTMVAPYLLQLVVDLGITYFFFEYDFKPCVMRSTKKHELAARKPCECHKSPHGKFMSRWMVGAKTLFWCSGGQRDKFYGLYPHLKGKTVDFVQNSTFYPETILNLRALREKKERGEIKVEDRWVVWDSESWIKGTEDSVAYCKEHNMSYALLKNLPNEKFLGELVKSKGLMFHPRDIDVGSRTLVECKLLGCEFIGNDFVLPQFEPWFSLSLREIEEFQLDGPSRFWRILKENS